MNTTHFLRTAAKATPTWLTVLLVASGLILGAASARAAPDTARLNSLLTALDTQGMAMGSLAVQQGSGPVFSRAIGHARLASGSSLLAGEPTSEPSTGPTTVPTTAPTTAPTTQLATPRTRYRIGSISKLMTAVMVLQLVDEGALKLDTPIARWFPQLPVAERITVAQLLQHRSGLGDIKNLPDFDKTWMFAPRAEADLISAITSLPREFEPGARASYNNSGFLLLSFILEKAGGQPYAQALQQRLVRPLALRETTYDLQASSLPQEAASYRWADRWVLARATHPSLPRGAGGVLSSPSDLVKFMRALFQGQLLKPATLQQMLQLQDGFGLGIYKLAGAGPEAWGHEGTIDGFSAVLAHFPAMGTGAGTGTDTTIAWCGNGHRLPREEVQQLLRRAVFEPQARLPSFAPVQAEVNFAVHAGQPTPAAVSVRGNATPLTWDRNWPLALDPSTGLWKGQVTLTVRDGVPLEFKYLKGDQQWETTPNRAQMLSAGQQAQRADVFNQDASTAALRQEVLAADDSLFGAYNRRDVVGMAAVFSERLEFFHDKGGLSNYADNLRAFENIFKTNEPVRRDRVAADQEVFPLGTFGAFHSGSHRFCLTTRQPESCQTYRYANVWERTAQGLRLLRVISYDH
jgi:D-alanyl-D-alanine carboxypeptidase